MKQDETTSLRFGSYEVLTKPDGTLWELGAGGFGRTFRARHRLLGTEVALKVIHDRHAFDDRAKARFIREAQEQAGLVHPGIARITYCDEIDGTLFYVMDLCDGGDLQRYVEQAGPLDPAEAFYLIEQAADAMQFAHGRGLIHRDIKPSNLLLIFTEEGMPVLKLIDFGLVKRIDGNGPDGSAAMLTQDGQSLFSPAFASPEQMREQVLDAKSDIFSLGMTLWFLLAGGRPIEGSTAEIVSDRLNTQDYEKRLPPSLTGPARAVLARMIRKSPADRYQNARQLLEDIRSCRQHMPVETTDWQKRQRKQASLHQRYEVEPAGQSALGTVFRGRDRRSEAEVDVTALGNAMAPAQLQQVLQTAKRLVETRHTGVVQFYEVEQYEEGWTIVREHPRGETMLNLLRRHGPPGLQRALPLLQELAGSFDTLERLRVPSVAAHPSEIILQARTSSAAAQAQGGKGTFDWQNWRPRLQPQLTPSARMESDPGVTAVETMVSHDGDFRPGFAGLVHWLVAGKAVPNAARLDPSGYTAIPGLGEESNRILAHVIAGVQEVESCEALLRQLQHTEGISEKKVEADRRKALWEMFNTLATEAASETARLQAALSAVEGQAAACPEAAELKPEASGFRQQADDAMLSLTHDALPETASSTILYATLTEAEGALGIIREAVLGAEALAVRGQGLVAARAAREARLQAALEKAAGSIGTAMEESGHLLEQAQEAAKLTPDAGDLLASVQQWTDRITRHAHAFNTLSANAPADATGCERAVNEAASLAEQSSQALDQMKNWARQLLRLAERAQQAKLEEQRARSEAVSRLDAISRQAAQVCEAVTRDAAAAAGAAQALPAAAPCSQRAAEAVRRSTEARDFLQEITRAAPGLSLPDLQHQLNRALELQTQLRDHQASAAQAAREGESLVATHTTAERQQREQVLAESRRLVSEISHVASAAEAQVKEADKVAMRLESAGSFFVAATRAARAATLAAREARGLLDAAEKGGPADPGLLGAIQALHQKATASGSEVARQCEEARRLAVETEQRRQTEEREREAVRRTVHQCAANAETSFHQARDAVSALPEASALPPAAAPEAQAIRDQLREARLLLRGMQEAVASVATIAAPQLHTLAEEAPGQLHMVTQLCGEIRQGAAMLARKLAEPPPAPAPPPAPPPAPIPVATAPAPSPVTPLTRRQAAPPPPPKKRGMGVLLGLGALVVFGAGAGIFWYQSHNTPGPGPDKSPITPPPQPPAATDFVLALEIRGQDLPADLASLKIEGIETLGALLPDSSSPQRLTVRVKGASGQPFRLTLPAGYSTIGDLRTAPTVVVDIARDRGSVTLTGTRDPLYSQAIFVWKSPLPDQPMASQPRNPESAAPLNISTPVPLPTGIYDVYLDDGWTSADTPANRPDIARRSAGTVQVTSAPSEVRLPLPWPRKFEGTVLVTYGGDLMKNQVASLSNLLDNARKALAATDKTTAAKLDLPVVSLSSSKYPTGIRVELTPQFEALVSSVKAEYAVNFFAVTAQTTLSLEAAFGPGKVLALFKDIPKMPDWKTPGEAHRAMQSVNGVFQPQNLSSALFDKQDANALAALEKFCTLVNSAWTTFQNAKFSDPLTLTLRSVDARGRMEFTRRGATDSELLLLEPGGADGQWKISGDTKNNDSSAREKTISGEVGPLPD